jgi:hypothetical protein
MDPWAATMMNEPFLQICDPISNRLDLLFTHCHYFFSVFIFQLQSLGSTDWPADMGSSGLENWVILVIYTC